MARNLDPSPSQIVSYDPIRDGPNPSANPECQARVRELVRQRPYRADNRSPEWLGGEVARWFGMDVSRRRDRIRIIQLLNAWEAKGVIERRDLRDPMTRQTRTYFVEGEKRNAYAGVAELVDSAEPIEAAKPAKPSAITPREYGGLQDAFDHFNRVLFDGVLSDLFIVYQRRSHSKGHFAPKRFADRIGDDGDGRDELSLNPDHFIGESDAEICSTLVHEMVHKWQEQCGTPSKRYSYHNAEWAARMKAIGLQPSNTGAVGGKETGQQMQHYILPGCAFDIAYQQLAAMGWKLNLQSAVRPGPQGKGPNVSKLKFTCPQCDANVWGKPDSKPVCGVCNPLAAPRMLSAADRTIEEPNAERAAA